MSESSRRGTGTSRRQFLRQGAALGALAMCGGLLASCQPASPAQPAGPTAPAAGPATGAEAGQLPRSETLYVNGFQWGPPTTFNPLASAPAWPSTEVGRQVFEHIHETLFGFNLLSGALDPMLGQKLEWPDRTTAIVTLHAGTRWQDGQPLTVDDVVYTFELAKRHADLLHSVVWDYLSELKPLDDRTVQFKLNPDRLNPAIVKQYLAYVRILPQHVWKDREASGQSPAQYADVEPIGSGPYELEDQSPERVVLARDDNYWGKSVFGTPKPRYIVHPIFKSNDDGNLAFERGEIDLSQQFVPQIWQMWERKNLPVHTWFRQEPYHLPGTIPLLFINLQKKPLDDPRVRRALAYSINYPQIAATAMSRYSVPARSSLLVPQGVEEKFFDEERVRSFGWDYNLQKATEILEKELGATRGSDGIYVLPDSTRLGPFTVQTPYGWTDWMTALEIVSQSAKAVGIEIRTEFPEAPIVTTRMGNGEFELALWSVAGVSAAGPWLRFRDVLDNRGVPPVGERAFWNYGRYNNPAIGGLLDQAAAATEEEQKRLYGELDRIFMQDVPVIPLMYRPLEFFEIHETTWTGFPDSENPAAPPTQAGAGIKMLYTIRPKG